MFGGFFVFNVGNRYVSYTVYISKNSNVSVHVLGFVHGKEIIVMNIRSMITVCSSIPARASNMALVSKMHLQLSVYVANKFTDLQMVLQTRPKIFTRVAI